MESSTTIFSSKVKRFIFWIVLVETPLFVIAYWSGLSQGLDAARTRLFLAFVFGELALALSCRSLRHPITKARPGKWLTLSVIWEIILILVLVAIPVSRAALRLTYPTPSDAAWTLFLMLTIFGLAEGLKFAHRERRRTARVVAPL